MQGAFFRHRTALSYSLFYAGHFILLGIQLPFFAGWLALHSFSPEEIGWITGAALIARLLLGPPIAYWADHQLDERLPLRAVTFFFALGGIGLLLAPSKLMIAAAGALVIFSFGLLVPLTDTAVLRADRNGHLHYGQTRAAGSGFFLAATIIGGVILSKTGIGAVGAIMALSASFSFAMSFLLPKGAGDRGGVKPMSWREAPRLVRNRIFLTVLFAAGLTQGAHAVYYAFSYLRWEVIGYSPAVIGMLWATGVLAEIILLTRARGLSKLLSPWALLALGAAGAAIRWTITAFEPPLFILFIVQMLHALTFACAYLGALEFLDRAAPTRLINTGMTLMSTTGVGAITGLATVAAGYVWQNIGPAHAYFLMAGMGVCAGLLAVSLRRQWNGERIFE